MSAQLSPTNRARQTLTHPHPPTTHTTQPSQPHIYTHKHPPPPKSLGLALISSPKPQSLKASNRSSSYFLHLTIKPSPIISLYHRSYLVKVFCDTSCHPSVVVLPGLHQSSTVPHAFQTAWRHRTFGPSADPSESASELSLIHRNESSLPLLPHNTHRPPPLSKPTLALLNRGPQLHHPAHCCRPCPLGRPKSL